MLEELLEPVFKDSYGETLEKMSPVEKAQYNASIAFTLNTIAFLLLKINDCNAKHTMKELKRVQELMKTIKTTINPEIEKRNFSIDVSVAQRVIKAGIGRENIIEEPPKKKAKLNKQERAAANVRKFISANSQGAKSAAQISNSNIDLVGERSHLDWRSKLAKIK
eukprot:TRINITY_DN2686_c0_g1_i1.p1 TRINITY_DN2686_c0_g1~~TRINITY_DN2686_c0_g1_i1.p1  ORF type:complete len:178 (-),score=29.28 TRINITY_DN2686_c0_g1_i1:177-671(-)